MAPISLITFRTLFTRLKWTFIEDNHTSTTHKRLSIVNHKRSHHIKHLFSIVVFDNMSSRFTFSACAASYTDSAEMTGPGLVKLNRSILWKYGCPGSFKYCKMTQHYRKTHHKRKPSQVKRQTVKSHSACSIGQFQFLVTWQNSFSWSNVCLRCRLG